VGAVAIIGFVTLLGVDLAEQQAGCGSVDPTDPANYSEVFIANDTNAPVTVDACEGAYCLQPNPPDVLDPGSRVKVRGACASTGSDMTSYRLTTSAGDTLGFIAIDTPRKTDGLVYDVSGRSADRSSPATPE